MKAPGVSALLPFLINSSAICLTLPTPMRNINVSTAPANLSKWTSDLPLVGSSCPVITAKEAATFLWVTGIPAYAGAAMAEVIPGTSSKGTPASFSTSISSPPRPNTKGSPPFKRATTFPCFPFSARRQLISSCVMVWFPDCFPTYIYSASGLAKRRILRSAK